MYEGAKRYAKETRNDNSNNNNDSSSNSDSSSNNNADSENNKTKPYFIILECLKSIQSLLASVPVVAEKDQKDDDELW